MLIVSHVKQNYFEMILKLFQCFISHVITVSGYMRNKTLK